MSIKVARGFIHTLRMLELYGQLFYSIKRKKNFMRITCKEQWDEAGGILQMMILTLLSTKPTQENEKDLMVAIESLEKAKQALLRLQVYSADFDPNLYHY